MSAEALIALEGVGFGYAPDMPLFADVNLRLLPGECHCLLGATGSGKSTLLYAMAALNERPLIGRVLAGKGVRVALVMQDPQVQLIRRTVGAEVAFGLENIGLAPELMPAKVQAALKRTGLNMPLETRVDTLSLGQKYRLMLASQLVLEPRVLLLDEPWAQLDDAGVTELQAVLVQLKAQGMAIVIAEHHPEAFQGLIDKCWQLGQQLVPVAAALSQPQGVGQAADFRAANLGNKVLTIGPFELKPDAKAPPLLVSAAPLSLSRGELSLLVGDNGSGKSTLLKAMAGLLDGARLPITVNGRKPKPGKGGMALMLQRPCRQLFELSVREELAFGIRHTANSSARVAGMLSFLNISHLGECSPHKLSWGQQHLVLLASLMLTEPAVLLLDDPFAGLDHASLGACLRLLEWYLSEGGACLLACHRVPQSLTTQSCWRIAGGALFADDCGQQPRSRCIEAAP